MRRNTTPYGLLIAFLITGLFSGCSEKLDPKPFTYSQLLTGTTSKTWRLTGIRVIENGNVQRVNVANNCVFDDLYVFHNDDVKTFEVNEGASKCDPADPDIFVQDTWSLVNATASLTFAIPILTGQATYPFIIKSLTETELVVEIYFETDNASYRFIFTPEKEG